MLVHFLLERELVLFPFASCCWPKRNDKKHNNATTIEEKKRHFITYTFIFMSPKEEIKKTSTKIDFISYLDVSINKSVPSPMRSISTIRQTVARYSLVTVIPPLSRHFSNCCFPPKVNVQPFITIVSARAPRPCLTRSWDLVKAGKLGNVIGTKICRCWYRVVGKMTTLHSQR